MWQKIESVFEWPIFLKGSRQTSKHDPELSIIRSATHYEKASQKYREDPILHWQKPVVREFVDLAPAVGVVPNKVAASIEFRTFWWFGECVGWGQYWYQLEKYEAPGIANGLELARTAAGKLRVPFVVIDIALTAEGRWIVIECNDAQESGYTGVSAVNLWRNILRRTEALPDPN